MDEDPTAFVDDDVRWTTYYDQLEAAVKDLVRYAVIEMEAGRAGDLDTAHQAARHAAFLMVKKSRMELVTLLADATGMLAMLYLRDQHAAEPNTSN